MGYFDTCIHDNTCISWVIEAIGRQIQWPPEYFSIAVGTRHFKYVHRLKDRDQSLLQDLRRECLQQGIINGDAPLPITLVLPRPPETLGRCLCICDFPGHGCCITGRSDDDRCALTIADGRSDDDRSDDNNGLAIGAPELRHYGCKWCGNCGICRCGDCGHACCKERVAKSEERRGLGREAKKAVA